MSGPRRQPDAPAVSAASQARELKRKHEIKQLAIENLHKRLQSPRLRSPLTLKSYLHTAKVFMGWLPHDPPATDADFRDYFTWRREKNISERTLRTEYFAIKKLADANHWPWPFIKEETPVSKTKAFAPAHSIQDIEKLIAARDKFTKGERFFLACSTTWGCRREELSRIGKRDYNNEIITLHIAKRNVDVEHLIPEVLKPIFEAYHPAHLTPTALSYVYHRICEKAGVPHPTSWGWHSIRRMVMTALAEALAAHGLQESWAATYMAWAPESVGRTFGGSPMAGVYEHGSEATKDPWRKERLIIDVHPFVRCWLKPTVKHEPTFK
jgi:integrase